MILNPDVVKVEDAAASPATGFPLRFNKASKGEAVVGYRNPLATQKMQYHRLSRRVNNRTIFLLMLDVTFGEFDKTP